MKTKVALSYVIVALAMAGLAGCGSSGSGAAAATGGDTTATGADVSSLTTLPTSDLSAYDTTESVTASLSAPAKSLAAKEVPGAEGTGKLCRACCEANMQKKQIFRSSVMAQQMRCYAEAFQKAGLITAGTDAYNIYSMTPPTERAEDNVKKCAGIPAERTDEIAACTTEDEGAKSGVLMRLGVFGGNELRVDVCKSKPTPVHQNEGTYSLSGETATTTVIHMGKFGGRNEKMRLTSTITGMTGIDSDMVPTLKSSGIADATASMEGGFGSGTITFKRVEADSSILVSGAFAGKVKEYTSGVEAEFTGKAYAKGGGTTTKAMAAKYSFTGSPPPMPLSKMIPFDIPVANLPNFFQVMSTQFGFSVTSGNYASLWVCPNPLFDPAVAAANPDVKPMVLADATLHTCPTTTHSGTECGTITNGSEDSGFTGMGKKITQTFATIACTDPTVSTFYAAVKDFNLDTLLATITPITFSTGRDWDCSGTATPLNFSTLTPAQGQTLQDYMQKCNALEEKGRGNDGMGEHDCSAKDGANALDDVKKAPPTNGALGGPYTIVAGGGTCAGTASGVTLPSKFFIAPVNPTDNKYCIPNNSGRCVEFTVAGATVVVSVPVKVDNTDITVSQLELTGGNPPTGLTVTWGSCTQTYTKDASLAFTAPSTEDGKAGDFPTQCVARGLTTGKTCGDYCRSHPCTPPH